jgi:hypothetical protein
MTESTATKHEATTKKANEKRTAEQHEATTANTRNTSQGDMSKPARKEKPVENGNGKIKSTQFSENKKVIEAIIKAKKLDERETASVKYFVNFVINEYNREVIIENI